MELQSLPNGLWQDVGTGQIYDDASARRMIVSGQARRAVQHRIQPIMPDVPDFQPSPSGIKKKWDVHPIAILGVAVAGYLVFRKGAGWILGKVERKRKP